MSLEAQDSPTTRTTCRILILLFIVISVQATEYVIGLGGPFCPSSSIVAIVINLLIKKLRKPQNTRSVTLELESVTTAHL